MEKDIFKIDKTTCEEILQDVFQKFYKDSILRIVSGICHELKSPLQAISSSTTVLQELGDTLSCNYAFIQCNNLKNINEFLVIIIEAQKRMSDIINLLSCSLKEYISDNYENIIIDDFFSELRDQIQYFTDIKLTKAKLEIIKLNDVPEKIKVIPSYLKQILLNLITNSISSIINYNEKNGKIRIIINYVNDCLEIFVEDNGCGIPEENQEKIFEPFFTSKLSGSNVGLGLFVSQNLAGYMNGKIELFNSVPGKTTMRLTLTKI